jgi:hypothetical protein
MIIDEPSIAKLILPPYGTASKKLLLNDRPAPLSPAIRTSRSQWLDFAILPQPFH